MKSALLGVVLDSSSVITAERRRQPVPRFIEAIFKVYSEVNLSLSPVTIAELVHGVYRARTMEAGQRRREYVESLIDLIPVHPVTHRTAWLVGQIEGQEAAKGNVLSFNDMLIAASALEQESALKADPSTAAYKIDTGSANSLSCPEAPAK